MIVLLLATSASHNRHKGCPRSADLWAGVTSSHLTAQRRSPFRQQFAGNVGRRRPGDAGTGALDQSSGDDDGIFIQTRTDTGPLEVHQVLQCKHSVTISLPR